MQFSWLLGYGVPSEFNMGNAVVLSYMGCQYFNICNAVGCWYM
jgi:hypothetical protein